MKKAQFNYYNYTYSGFAYQLLLLNVTFVLLLGLLKMNPTVYSILFSVAYACWWLARHILNNLKSLSFKNGQIILTHLITNKVQKLEVAEVAGYKPDRWTQNILLVDAHDQAIARIHEPFYKNLEAFLLENNIKKLDTDTILMTYQWDSLSMIHHHPQN